MFDVNNRIKCYNTIYSLSKSNTDIFTLFVCIINIILIFCLPWKKITHRLNPLQICVCRHKYVTRNSAVFPGQFIICLCVFMDPDTGIKAVLPSVNTFQTWNSSFFFLAVDHSISERCLSDSLGLTIRLAVVLTVQIIFSKCSLVGYTQYNKPLEALKAVFRVVLFSFCRFTSPTLFSGDRKIPSSNKRIRDNNNYIFVSIIDHCIRKFLPYNWFLYNNINNNNIQLF